MPYEKVDPEELTPFDPPVPVPCPQCDGELYVTGFNKMKTLVFVDCQGECRLCFILPWRPR